MPRTSPYRILLTEDERRRLEAAARRYTSSYRDVVRARIVLYAAEGLGNDESERTDFDLPVYASRYFWPLQRRMCDTSDGLSYCGGTQPATWFT